MEPAIGANSSCNEPREPQGCQAGKPDLHNGRRILIVGASARAAAESARRGGLRPWAADLFCDEDLRACCHAVRIENYPHGAAQALSSAPPGPWMYTGALENYPELIERLADIRPLDGIGGESLRAVRDPVRLADAIRAAGFPAPRCTLSPAGVPTDKSWLSKPLASAGGHGIVRHAVHADAASAPPNRYFQERIDGLPASAVYLAAADGARCLGVTRQLLGLPWCGIGTSETDRFRYCGSIGPLKLAPPLADRFNQLGNAIARAFRLVGLFGIDVILRGNEIWPIEVNPRFVASIEILERAYDFSAVRLHVDACQANARDREAGFEQEEREETEELNCTHLSLFPLFPPVQSSSTSRSESSLGKAILYAREDVVIGDEFSAWIRRANSGRTWPVVADVPSPGVEIQAGHPIVTVFAAGPDDGRVFRDLEKLAAEAYESLTVRLLTEKSSTDSPTYQ